MPKDIIARIEDYYHLPLQDLIQNVADCNNKKPPTDFDYASANYPPCFFGLPYVEGGDFDGPFHNPANKADLPDWVPNSKDSWSQPRSDYCEEWKILNPGQINIICEDHVSS